MGDTPPDFNKPVNASRLAKKAEQLAPGSAPPASSPIHGALGSLELPAAALQGRPASSVAPLGPLVPPPALPSSDEDEVHVAATVQRTPESEAAVKTRVQRLKPQDEGPEVLTTSTLSPRHQIEAWLAGMAQAGASDLILRAGARPSRRVAGKIHFMPGRVPGPGPLLEVLKGVLGEERMKIWRETGSADSALELDGLGRFRLNAYKQMGEPAVVIRRINEEAPDISTLGLPIGQIEKLAMRKRGLMLVTGIAGSGKSTTLAGMIQYMNESVERHVITLEDPVELIYKERNCVISQREVGTDCADFGDGLRHALRQSPDVILIGEMRDAETVSAALDATETGHLVLSTLHTVNAPQTVDRILSFFPSEQHQQLRTRLADNLAGVLSQRLIPKMDKEGMVPAFELLVSTPHVRELLTEGNTAEMARVIEQGTEDGLISFNQCLRQLVVDHVVDLKEALAASDKPDDLVLALRGITASHGRPQRDGGRETPPPSRPDDGAPGLRMARGE
jgi:twitching motility protein PilT